MFLVPLAPEGGGCRMFLVPLAPKGGSCRVFLIPLTPKGGSYRMLWVRYRVRLSCGPPPSGDRGGYPSAAAKIANHKSSLSFIILTNNLLIQLTFALANTFRNEGAGVSEVGSHELGGRFGFLDA